MVLQLPSSPWHPPKHTTIPLVFFLVTQYWLEYKSKLLHMQVSTHTHTCLRRLSQHITLISRRRQNPPAKKLISKETQGRVCDYLFNLLWGKMDEGGEFKHSVISWWISDHKVRPQLLLWRYTLKYKKRTRDVLAAGEGWNRGLTKMF